MSKLPEWAVGACVAVALSIVIGWPALATVLEASRAAERAEAWLRDWQWTAAADALARWSGAANAAGGSALDAASSEATIQDNGSAARKLRLAWETTRLVVTTEALALPAGVLLALLLVRTDVWGRRFFLGVLALAAFVPLPLHATAWLGAFGNAGRSQAFGLRPILVGHTGAAVVHALAALPWVVFIVGIGLAAVEPELEEMTLLECGPWGVIWRVTLRRSLGAIAAAALAVALLTAGDMTVTDLLQIRTYAEESYVQFILGKGPADAATVALPPLVVFGVLILLMSRSLDRVDPGRIASSFARSKPWRLGAWRIPAGIGLVACVGNMAAVPIYALVWRAGRVGGRATLGQPPVWSWSGLMGTLRYAADDSWDSLWTSILWTSVAATATTCVAAALAWEGRGSTIWKWVILCVLALTLATPGPVAGMALRLAYLNIPAIYDSQAMLVLAAMVRSLPYALLLLWPFLRAFPRDWLDAAALDGYGPTARFLHVILPLSARALVAAWAIAFAIGLGELPATNLVAPPGVPPISVVIWTLLHVGVESHLAGVALIMLGAVAVAGLGAGVAVWSLRAVLRSSP